MPSNFTFYTFYMLCYTEILKRDNMQRKIIQVITKEDALTPLTVLCDDGTIWERYKGGYQNTWTQIELPELPDSNIDEENPDLQTIISQLDNIYTMLRDN